MPKTVISVENLSKHYRLGVLGGATFREEFSRFWARKLGRPDPWARIGEANHGNRDGEHIWALRDVSLEVKEGEILGIIGRNGAGKSTLLKILSRITAPTSGRAVIRGRVGSLLEVGTGFHPELTGRENIYLNGTILGMTRAEVTRKLEEIVEFAEIGPFIDTPVKRYSSGMTVRLAFAVAAHLEPEILIVDEVLAVGDAAFQKKCLGKMGEVASTGRTILFVTHNLSSVSRLCRHAVWIDQGHIVKKGIVDVVLSEYSKSFDAPHGMEESDLTTHDSISLISIGAKHPKNDNEKIFANGPCVFSISGTSCGDFENLTAAIGIYDEKSRNICLLDSRDKSVFFKIKKGRFSLECSVEAMPLYPGFYYLNVSISSKNDVVVGAEKLGHIFIKDSDKYITGRLPRFGPLLVSNSWKTLPAMEREREGR